MPIDRVLYMIPIGPMRLYPCQNLLSKLILIALGCYTLPFIIDALVHLDIYYDHHMQKTAYDTNVQYSYFTRTNLHIQPMWDINSLLLIDITKGRWFKHFLENRQK